MNTNTYNEYMMNTYNETSINMNLLNNCLDINELDRWFQRSCCDLYGYKGCYNFKQSISSNIDDEDGTGTTVCPMNTFIEPSIPFSSPNII